MRSYSSRAEHVWYLLFLISLMVGGVVFYHYLLEYVSFTPESLSLIDNIYLFSGYIVSITLATAFISFLFQEMRDYARNGHILIGKFIPLIRFVSIALVWITGIFLYLHDMGIDTSKLLTGAGIGGAIFALASKDILSNLIGSLTIIMSQMFDIGDRIALVQRTPRVEGVIEEITLNYTKIMSYDGNIAYIPNRVITNETIENMSKSRYTLYAYKIPFKRIENKNFIKQAMEEIEEKINSYNPIKLDIFINDPTVNDYIYQIEVTLPSPDRDFEKDIRHFLYGYIYRGEKETINNLQK